MLCWGNNEFGQVGIGPPERVEVPTPVTGLVGEAVAVAAGYYHTCALSRSGRVMCWGANYFGQLGDGTFDQRNFAVEVAGLGASAIAIAVGDFSSCALLGDRRLACWGYNGAGELGYGDAGTYPTPQAVLRGVRDAGSGAPIPMLAPHIQLLLASLLALCGALALRRSR